MVPADFRVQTKSMIRRKGLNIRTVPLTAIAHMWAIWRTQKNKQHGKEKLFARNPNPEGFCFVASVYRALLRFRRLRKLEPRIHPQRTPLSIYWSPKLQAVQLLNNGDITTFMRRLAMVVYKLHPVDDAEELKKWSSHSLRIGA